MDVLSLTNELGAEKFGGAGTAVTGMLTALARIGVRQTVLAPMTTLEAPVWIDREENLKVLALPRSKRYFGELGLVHPEKVLEEFPELSRSWDLIHVHASNFAPLAYRLACGSSAISLVYSVYSFLREEIGDLPAPDLQRQYAVQEELLLRCHRIHLVSRSQSTFLTLRLPHLLLKARVIPLGFNPAPGWWQAQSPYHLLYAGRLLEYKGIEDLLEALALVKRTGLSFRLDVIGKGDLEYEGKLRMSMHKLKLSPQVKFHGWIEDPDQVRVWMQRSGVLVIPSRREAYGLTALEGMAAGVPLIASNAGGLGELLDSSTALIYKAGDVKELAGKLETALRNPQLMRSLALKAKEKSVPLAWPLLAKQYLQLYQSVARG